jgi:hypothetical protein
MVQSWINDPASNHGILLSNPGGATDGVDFDSREVSSVRNRPKLTILYLPAERPLLPADFTLDDTVDVNDITSMCHAVRAGSREPVFDLAGDGGPAGQTDLDFLIRNILNTDYGDANLDGVFNSGDFVQVFVAGEYEDRVTGNSTWAEGDWDCDAEFTTSDMIVAFVAGAYVDNARPAIQVDPGLAPAIQDEQPTDLQRTAAAVDWVQQVAASGVTTDAAKSETVTESHDETSRRVAMANLAAISATYKQAADRFYELGLEAPEVWNEMEESLIDDGTDSGNSASQHDLSIIEWLREDGAIHQFSNGDSQCP